MEMSVEQAAKTGLFGQTIMLAPGIMAAKPGGEASFRAWSAVSALWLQ
jgi:hypothetical protein